MIPLCFPNRCNLGNFFAMPAVAISTYISGLILLVVIMPVPAAGYSITVEPGISLRSEYTDNLNLDNEDAESDLIIILSPAVDARVTGQTGELLLTYNPEHSYYKKHSENNTLRHLVSCSVAKDFTRHAGMMFGNTFNRTEESQEFEELDAGTDGQGRFLTHTNEANLSFSYQFGRDDNVTAGYNNIIYNTDDPQGEDNLSHGPFVRLRYWFVPGKLGMQAETEYTRVRYADLTDDFDSVRSEITLLKRFTRHFEIFAGYGHSANEYYGDTNNYRINEVNSGFEWLVTRSASVSSGVGYYIRDVDSSGSESGFSLNLSVDKNFRHGSLGLSGAYGYEELYLGSEILGFSTFYTAECSGQYNLTRNLGVSASVSFGEEKYEDADPARRDEILGADVGITYRHERWLAIQAGYSWQEVDSTETENSYEENSVFISIGLSMSHPIRIWN